MKPKHACLIKILTATFFFVITSFIFLIPKVSFGATQKVNLLLEAPMLSNFAIQAGAEDYSKAEGIVYWLKSDDWVLPARERRNKGFWAWLQGLGRRGSCSNVSHPLVALTPYSPNLEGENSSPIAEGIALSVSERPTLWFYIPQELVNVEYAEFMIQNEYDQDVIEVPLQLNLEHSGLVSFQWPEQIPPLKVGHPYHWYFSVQCDYDKPSRNLYVDDWIERADHDPKQLRSMTLDEKLAFYSRKNIWYETLTLLALEGCQSYTQKVSQYWETLFTEGLPSLNEIEPQTALKDYCQHNQRITLVSQGRSH